MFPSNPSLEFPSNPSIHVSPPFGSSFFDHDNIHGVYLIPHEHNSNLDITANTQDLICQQQQQLHVQGSVLQYSDDYDDLLESIVYPCKKKTMNSKKDGHSKIYTAQGPRDRRVRLSIDIARKFFELQNLLGFDKASKTLDWLFTKSKVAIRELVEQTKHSSSSIVTTCESAFLYDDDDDLEGKKKAEFKFGNGKVRKITQKHKSEQSRAEARARARERTKEKLRIQKQQYEDLKEMQE